jgi:hypothetical protein
MVRLACALCMRVARRRAGCRPQELLTSNGFRMVASDLLRSDSSPVRTNLVGVMAEIVFIAALFTLPDFVRRSNGHSPTGAAPFGVLLTPEPPEALDIASGTPERAAREQPYLKSQLEFLGTSVPHIRREAKSFTFAHPELEREGLRALAEAAWASSVHELRSVAIGILELKLAVLEPADVAWLIGLVERSDTWAPVDWLAVKVIGALTERYPALARLRMPRRGARPRAGVLHSQGHRLGAPLRCSAAARAGRGLRQ